ncbi:MAG: hypothetical protein K6L76_09280 [Agarilytica sp.]
MTDDTRQSSQGHGAERGAPSEDSGFARCIPSFATPRLGDINGAHRYIKRKSALAFKRVVPFVKLLN